MAARARLGDAASGAKSKLDTGVTVGSLEARRFGSAAAFLYHWSGKEDRDDPRQIKARV